MKALVSHAEAMTITQQKGLRKMMARTMWVRVRMPKRMDRAIAAGKEGE